MFSGVFVAFGVFGLVVLGTDYVCRDCAFGLLFLEVDLRMFYLFVSLSHSRVLHRSSFSLWFSDRIASSSLHSCCFVEWTMEVEKMQG